MLTAEDRDELPKRDRHSQSIPINNNLLARAGALVGRVMAYRHPMFIAVPVVKRTNVLSVALELGLRQLEIDMDNAELSGTLPEVEVNGDEIIR